MKKCKQLLALLCAAALSLSAYVIFAACSDKEGDAACELVESTQELVVIKANEGDGTLSLYDAMTTLQTENENFTFTFSDSMVTSVNGTENAADWSSCWMIYTDLTEYGGVTYATTDYGAYTYAGTEYASASYGVQGLPVFAGYTYILHYDTF